MNIVQIGTNRAYDDLTELIGNKEPDVLILIEPLSIHNNKIKECYSWVKNLYIENIVISNNKDIISFYYHELNGPEYVLASTSIEHILKHNYRIDGIKELKVQSNTINEIFDKYNIKDIDILYIDSEGFYFEIIKSIDYNKYNIKKIYFENLHIDKNVVHSFLEKLNYNIIEYIGENGWTNVAVKSKIKIVHLLNSLTGDREIKSINSLSKLRNYGIDYTQQLTPLYDGDEWKQKTPLTNYPHGKGHYGLYQSFTKAIIENFTEDLDALIICECDSILNISYDNFIDEINNTLNFCNKYGIYHFSWGGNTLNGVQQGDVIKIDHDYPNYCIVNKIILAHFTILTKESRNFYINKVKTLSWDSFDLWLNEAIYSEFNNPGKQATTFKPLAYQVEGLSLLDNFIKNTNKNMSYNYLNRDEFLNLINDLDLKIGCEIGVYKADYSIKILEKTNLNKLYLIDPWKHISTYNDVSNHDNFEFEQIYQNVKNRLYKYNDRVEIVRDFSENVVSNFNDNELDFVYLDADHSYESSKKDIELWYSKVKPGGIFSGHDYLNGSLPQGEFGVKRAIDEFVEKNKLKLYVTGENEWKSWFLIKPYSNNKVDVVMYCTENYYNTSINLIKTLNIFHDNFNIHLYEINFNINPNINNVKVINLNDDRIGEISFKNNRNDTNNKNMFRAIFLKSSVILHSLTELKLDKVLYLDSDILPNTKLDPIFKYFNDIQNYPLIQEGPADYLFIDGRGNPFTDNGFDKTKILEYPVCEMHNISIDNRIRYANASVMLYNKNCLPFIQEYDNVNQSTFNLSLEDIKYYYPFADETTINILLWKYKYNNRLPFIQVNIDNLEQVKEFYHSNYKEEKVYSIFTKIPSEENKPNKYIFHGIKNNISKEISEYVIDFYKNNSFFKFNIDIQDNKIYIRCNTLLKTDVKFYEWNMFNDNLGLLYNTTSYFDNNELWFSPGRKLNDINGLKIEILYNNVIIKEEFLKFKTIDNQIIPKQVLVLQSEVGIGVNLAATPIIKKISKVYGQKIILLTYIPDAFINNPYVENVVAINKYNYNQIISNYNSDKYKTHYLFNGYQTNWRMIDHKQLCAYNAGFQLKSYELDMQFYPDYFNEIENLPERFICINPSETEPERTWGYKNWQKFIDLIQQHIPVVAIGKETYLDPNLTKKFSNINIKNGLNLLNHPSQNTLSQAYHIISKSETFVTMNNGLYILSLCNLDNHITELSTSWDTEFYRIRKGVLNYNLDYITGTCKAQCLANPSLNVDLIGSTSILKSGRCYLNKKTYECHPTPEQVYEAVLKTINEK